AADADFPFDSFVIGREVVIADGPVGQRTASRHAVEARHAEILRHEAPCLRAIYSRAAAYRRRVVLVARLVRAHDASIFQGARVTVDVWPGVVAVLRQPLVAQMVAPDFLE